MDTKDVKHNSTNQKQFIAWTVNPQTNISNKYSLIRFTMDIELFNTYHTTLNKFQDYLNQHGHFIYLAFNYLELMNTTKFLSSCLQPQTNDFLSEIANLIIPNDPQERMVYTLLTQRIYNFISSTSTFLDYNQQIVCSSTYKDTYGDNFFTNYDSLRRKLHSCNIEYAVLYELRNYCFHQWFPPSMCRTIRKLDSNGASEATVSYLIKREEFIESTDKPFKEELKCRLQSLEEEFDMIGFTEKYFQCLKELHLFTINNQTDMLTDSLKYINDIIQLFKSDNQLPIIITECQSTNTPNNCRSFRIPYYYQTFLNLILG